jgi:3-phosphoshikimate 1-carboxyvinyltransferase
MNISIPGSKSITNRALLLAALAKGTSHLSGVLFSDDTWAFINALSALGVNIISDPEKKTCIVHGVNGKFPNSHAKIDCQEAGTVLRFLLAACAAAGSGKFYFDGAAGLRKRPISALIQILIHQGAEIEPEYATQMPFTLVPNGLVGGSVFVPGHESSQFLSALLMASPLAKCPLIFHTTELVSRPYVALTRTMMQEFGVTAGTLGSYLARDYYIEPDLSTASYFFAAAALTNSMITVPNINRQFCKQGDIRFLDILELMGCKVSGDESQTTVRGVKKLKGVQVDMNDISDTFMTLACLAPFADTPTKITGIGHTRLQESDRISAVADNMRRLGIVVDDSNDQITIYPSSPRAAVIDSHGDHRIAMAFSLIGLVIQGIVINNMDCVSKTCPNFAAMLACFCST